MKNRHLYPDDWEEISLRVRKAANWTCERCGKPCCRPGQDFFEYLDGLYDRGWDGDFEEAAAHRTRFVLTVAHLNHDPADNRRENLRALCAPCHLRYDAAEHAKTRARNRAARERDRAIKTGQLSLF